MNDVIITFVMQHSKCAICIHFIKTSLVSTFLVRFESPTMLCVDLLITEHIVFLLEIKVLYICLTLFEYNVVFMLLLF